MRFAELGEEEEEENEEEEEETEEEEEEEEEDDEEQMEEDEETPKTQKHSLTLKRQQPIKESQLTLHFSQTSLLDTESQKGKSKSKSGFKRTTHSTTPAPVFKRHSRPLIQVERPGPRLFIGRKGDYAYQCVGLLRGMVNGQNLKIRIELGRVLKIGRGEDADLTFRARNVSKKHLRIYTYRTTTQHSLICLHDLSHNGYILNGELQRAPKAVRINGKRYTQRATILRDGDTIQLPGSKAVLKLHMNEIHLPESGYKSQTFRPTPIFTEPLRSTYALPPFTIHNHPLGDGTYGVVNIATLTDDRSNTQLACKTTLLTSQQSRDINEEVAVLRKVSHPNVLGLIALIEEEKRQRMHLIQELATGGDLFAYIEKHCDGLREDEVRFLAWQMVEGLGYLHENGIVHRDIKPENILLQISSSYPRILLADFGHAIEFETILKRLPASSVQLERMIASPIPVENIGTSNYLPPERLYALLGFSPALLCKGKKRGSSTQSRREELARCSMEREKQLDMWALGCVLHFCASGSHPYDVNTELSLEPVHVPLPGEGGGPSQMSMDTSNIRGSTQDEGNRTGKGRRGLSHLDRRRPNDSRPRTYEDDAMQVDKKEGADIDMEEGESDTDSAQSSETKERLREILGYLFAFARLPIDCWCPKRQWDRYSDECKDFITSLMEEDERLRLKMKDVKTHQWMIDSEKEKIGETYDWVVVQGQSLIKW